DAGPELLEVEGGGEADRVLDAPGGVEGIAVDLEGEGLPRAREKTSPLDLEDHGQRHLALGAAIGDGHRAEPQGAPGEALGDGLRGLQLDGGRGDRLDVGDRVSGAVGDLEAGALDLHLELPQLARLLLRVGGLEGEDVVVARDVEDLTQASRDVVALPDEAATGSAGELGQGPPAAAPRRAARLVQGAR